MKLFLVDDDDAFRLQLANQLRFTQEFEVKEAQTGMEALAAIQREPFVLTLLDADLPDMDGREICRLFRRVGVTPPIIMVSAANSDADTILSLDAGANDYVAKPFGIGVSIPKTQFER